MVILEKILANGEQMHNNWNGIYSQSQALLAWFSDFIWPFLLPYMGVIPNPKMAFIFPISYILALIFPIFMKKFDPNTQEKVVSNNPK